MTREKEDEIMGWYIIMMISLFIAATVIATPVSEKTECTCTEVSQ